MGRTLLKTNKYNNMYVAVESFNSSEVIAAAKDADKVYEKALKKGYPNPLVFFVPKKGMLNLY